jgi:two-component system cell cycle sensor histidine kinase/response regulator CckA
MGKQRTILVVDDEDTERVAMTEALRGAGFQVIHAESYNDALAVAEANPGISFLVCDIALPDGNGCALASAIRQMHPKLRVLFVSGHVGSEVCRYYGLDVTDLHFLRKPFAGADLVACVKRVMKADEPFPNLYVPKTWSSFGS